MNVAKLIDGKDAAASSIPNYEFRIMDCGFRVGRYFIV